MHKEKNSTYMVFIRSTFWSLKQEYIFSRRYYDCIEHTMTYPKANLIFLSLTFWGADDLQHQSLYGSINATTTDENIINECVKTLCDPGVDQTWNQLSKLWLCIIQEF